MGVTYKYSHTKGHVWTTGGRHHYQQTLTAKLAKNGYFELLNPPSLWKHITRPTVCTLVMNDFGVHYERREHVEHLLAALEENYTIENNWEGKL